LIKVYPLVLLLLFRKSQMRSNPFGWCHCNSWYNRFSSYCWNSEQLNWI